jgi:dTDP-4-amino-4,6-dideoxygalactose transaminase
MIDPKEKIYLSAPCMLGRERELLLDAFDSNWIAPLGPHVNAFENEFAAKIGVGHAAALSSGTAAIHLALRIIGVEPGDEVLTSSFTFCATANAITYVGAKPVFIDSDWSSWNMDPDLLREELAECKKNGRLPKAVMPVDIVGQCCDYSRITQICQEFGVPLIVDAAEALGAFYDGKPAGSFGDINCFSFNGNKIITTSSGGMLVTEKKEWADRARFLSTQARDPAPHYEHSEIGHNYRMSNLLAAVGRGQLETLETHVDRRRAIFQRYSDRLGDCPGIQMMPEIEAGRSTRWLSMIMIDPDKYKVDREHVRMKLNEKNIESRPAWKPMHCQPVFADCRFRGREVSEKIFEQGLCLPSSSSLTMEVVDHIASLILSCRLGQ